MALLRRGGRDRLPSRQPLWRRARHRSFGLDGDEALHPDRGAGLDHGVEVRVREHRLEERDAALGFALDGSLGDDAPDDPPAAHVDDLDVVFGSLGNGDAVLTRANAKHAGQMVTLEARDDDAAIGHRAGVDERPEHPGHPSGPAADDGSLPVRRCIRQHGYGRGSTGVAARDVSRGRPVPLGPGRSCDGQQLRRLRPSGQLRYRVDHHRRRRRRRVARLVLAMGGAARRPFSARGLRRPPAQCGLPGGDRWRALPRDAVADGDRRLQRVPLPIPRGSRHPATQRARRESATPAARLERVLRTSTAGAAGLDGDVRLRAIHSCGGIAQGKPAGRATAGRTGTELPRPYRRARPRDWIVKEIHTQSGRQFDPSVAEALLEVVESGEVAVSGTAESALHEDHKPAFVHFWTQHLDAIQQLGARLATVVSVPEICDTIGRAITTLLPYDQCRIYLLEEDGRTLRPVYFSDTKRAEYDGVTAETLAIQLGEGITGWVAETKQGALVGDTERHPKGIHIPGTSETNESMLAVPVIFEDRLIGVIVNVKVGINQYTGDHLRLLTILANHAAVSIFNARLIERLAASARTDPLTGLANRRAFEQALEQRLAAAAPETFAVLMLDVDGLKQVNDARGHAAGDAVLKRVASVLSSDLRETDLATRWGGDEFLLLMPGVDQVGALSLARRIGGTLLNPEGPAGPISVSIGTAAFPADGTTAIGLLAAADRSMYVEKRQRVA